MSEEKEKRRVKLESLAPVILKRRDFKEYNKFFFRAMWDRTVCNVAITGEYGTGKSSVIETFLKRYRIILGKKCLRISLRNFRHEKKRGEIDALEKKLLNQIICQLDSHTISGSGIYTKQHLRENVKFSLYLLVFFLMLGGLYFVAIPQLSVFEEVRRHDAFPLFYENTVQLKMFTVLLAGIIFAICRVINQLPKGWFPDKISCTFRDNTVAVENSQNGVEKALLDTYMDEIVYLLNKQRIRLLIIEDLDRYDNIMIFEQLREINFLLNVNRIRKVKFFYLVKDSMFENNGWERTKFFDMILPVMSCVGKDNVWEKLQKMCPGLRFLEKKEVGLLDGFCSDHLDDYRMLKNIANEFNIIFNRYDQLGRENFSAMKIMCMVIYKNVFPQDYALLKNKAGYIYGGLQWKVEVDKKEEKERKEKLSKGYHGYIEELTREEKKKLSMDIQYWEKLQKHREYGMLDDLIRYEYIEEKDYLQYISIITAEGKEEILFRNYRYAIKENKHTKDLNFNTVVSLKQWNRLSESLHEFQYHSRALVNKSIINYMLAAVEDKQDVWWGRTYCVADSCLEKEKKIIYKLQEGTAKENWAVLAWSEDLFEWEDEKQKDYIMEYVVHALKGAGRYDLITEFYTDIGYEGEGRGILDEDDEERFPEDEPFLAYIFKHKAELFNALQEDEDALYVLLGLNYLGDEPYKIKYISRYADNDELLKQIWETKSFEPNRDNMHILIRRIESNDIHLEMIREIAPALVEEYLKDDCINAFVENYYLRYLLPNVAGKRAGGFEEIRDLLNQESLNDELKEKIIKYLPETAYPLDLSELSSDWRKKFIEEEKIGYSANNIVMLLREKGHIFTDEVCSFVEKCHEVFQNNPEDFASLTIELTDGEKGQILGALQKAYTDDVTDVWLSHQLGLFGVDDDPEVA
ncbi:MAG: hypothetical protein E7290_03160 [Lachnospiraceae bacterium]|nr:hypothetical protein [Lachnospiraceae bacterium]